MLLLWSSSSLTSFHEHFACFLVHPTHAVRFLRQSMCRRRQRSHGGKMRSPRCNSSMRATISILRGPPSSRCSWWLACLGCGSKDDGVLGIATVLLLNAAGPPNSEASKPRGCWVVDVDDDPAGGSFSRPFWSAVVKN